MPTLIRAYGLRFMIFPGDHQPPQVHVSGRGEAKIGIEAPYPVLSNKGMSKADIARSRNVVSQNDALLIDAWMQFHG